MRAVRAALRVRRERPSGGDVAYRIYLAIMLAIIVAAPIARGAVLSLAEEMPASASPLAIGLTGAALAGLAALAALAGAQTGPAHATLPEIDLLLGTALSRRRLLAGRVLRAIAGGAVLAALLAGVLLVARALRGEFDPAQALALGLGAACLGALTAIAMLLGQLGRAARWIVAGALGALAAYLALAPLLPDAGRPLALDPWSALAGLALASGSAEGPALLPATALAILFACLGAAAVALALALLPLLRRETMREQSDRLNAVSALAVSGDLRIAAARLGAPVRTGRRWAWRMPGGITAAIAARDLVGIARTPARSLAALAGVSGAAVLTGAVALQAQGPAWAAIAGAAALTVAYAAIGPWLRGMRAAAETVGGSPLLPLRPAGLLLRHLIVPGALALVVSAAASGIAAAAVSADPLRAACGGAALAALALLLRLSGALKGPLPERLLAPVPTPAGDLSSMNVLLWSLDGPIWALLLGAGLAAIATVGPVAALIALAASLAALAIWATYRLQAIVAFRG